MCGIVSERVRVPSMCMARWPLERTTILRVFIAPLIHQSLHD
eukprot:COSAG04_NODE_2532_length_3969_cov_1.360465_4_plen_42_part_00